MAKKRMRIEQLVHLRPTKEADLPYLAMMAQGQEVGIPPNYLEGGITAANHKTLRNYLKKVCYRILTGGTGYDVDQREIKEAK